jgi:alkyl sulfatase BDS1-like metallo-beta-lactamase superfamily hydrolase
MEDLLDLAERRWQGDHEALRRHPFSHMGAYAEVADGSAFVASFANVSAFATDDGLVLIDTGGSLFAEAARETLRTWSNEPLHTAVFTHGHIDHCFGVDRYEAENQERGLVAPHVVAHAALPARFDRYRATAGYNATINRRQFGVPDLEWPLEYRYPDETYTTRLDLDVGGTRFELHHARGETDDHTWVHVPERRVLCTGDLFIWASPNCGNPQKVQRYPKEWAVALHAMAELDADVLLPGHGLPVIGTDRVREALTSTARLLEYLHDETLAMMNDGASLDEIVHTVRAPAELLERPYLRPVYDEPEFVVRNIWRLYGGWYDGLPSRLKPAPDTAVARELAALAGGPAALAARATELADVGDLRLAAHLADWAAFAAPEDTSVHAARAAVYDLRVAAEASTMSKGVFRWAADESRRRADQHD